MFSQTEMLISPNKTELFLFQTGLIFTLVNTQEIQVKLPVGGGGVRILVRPTGQGLLVC